MSVGPKSVYFGIPAYGPIDPAFLRAVTTAALVCNTAGVAVELDIVSNCSLIAKARNEILHRFLASGYDSLFYLDADLDFSATDFFKVLHLPQPIVGGVYRTKTRELKYTFEPSLPIERSGPLMRAERLPGGFLRIHRDAAQRLAESAPKTLDGVSNVFAVGIRNGVYTGEDYAMCEDWLAMGGELWAYICDIGHCGRFEYGGHFDTWLNHYIEHKE